MPGVTVIADVAPVAIVVEIINPGNVIVDVVVTGVEMRGVVVIRIVEIRIVITITAVVVLWISRSIIVIDDVTGLVRFDFGNHRGLVVTLAGHRQILAPLNLAGTAMSHHLGFAVEDRRHRIPILINCNLIKPRLLEIYCATRCRNFKQIA
jgi:hypothetical protein